MTKWINISSIINSRKAKHGVPRGPRSRFFEFFYRSHWMVMLIFQELPNDPMTQLLQKHSFRYVQYLTTQTDPRWPLRAKICYYLLYNYATRIDTYMLERWIFLFPTFFWYASSMTSKFALSRAPLTLMINVAWPLNRPFLFQSLGVIERWLFFWITRFLGRQIQWNQNYISHVHR